MRAELGTGRVSAVPAAEPRRASWRLAAPCDVLLVQHRNDSPSGQLLGVLAERGLRPQVVRADRGRSLPDPASVRMAILLGTDRFAAAGERGYLNAELDWLRRADRAGTAVLGLGHGARALASSFGGNVQQAPRPMHGWSMVSTSVPHLIAAGPWLTWQHDVIGLPPQAQLLAQNRLGPQAFRIGRHLGVHFHPEATPQTLATWVATSDELVHAGGLLDTTIRDPAAAASCTRRLFTSFINMI
jgi:GMP synthase-like glutamine amidotransferase